MCLTDQLYILGLFPPVQAVCSNAQGTKAHSEIQILGWSGRTSRRRWAGNWALKVDAIPRVGADLGSVLQEG